MAEADDSVSRVGYIFHTVDKKDLKPGDHIYCHRLHVAYRHHGIYIGEPGCEVIHFAGDGDGSFAKRISQQNDAKMNQVTESANECDKSPEESSNLHNRQTYIRSTTMDNFLIGDRLRLVSYGSSTWKKTFSFLVDASHTMKAMPPSETVKLAKHFLNHPEEWGNYHLRNNNCETFATFCKTGQMNVAAQLNYFRLISEIKMKPSCETFEEALEKYRAQHQNWNSNACSLSCFRQK